MTAVGGAVAGLTPQACDLSNALALACHSVSLPVIPGPAEGRSPESIAPLALEIQFSPLEIPGPALARRPGMKASLTVRAEK